MEERYAKLTVVCGRRMTGKTNYTLEQIFRHVSRGKKALLYDVTDEFGNYVFRPGEPAKSIKPIFFRDIPRFSVQKFPEVVRTRPMLDDGTPMGIKDMQRYLGFILDKLRNCILLVEDVTKYVPANTPMDIMGKFSTLRQRGVDVIMQYQHVGKAANPQIIGQANYIRLHKTNDRVITYKDGFQDKIDIMLVAESIVNRRYEWGMKNGIKDRTGQFFHVLVDLEYGKIRGIFTKQEAEIAIEEYMSDNAKLTVNKLMNQKDRRGNNKYTNYESAYSIFEQRMMDDLFTFK